MNIVLHPAITVNGELVPGDVVSDAYSLFNHICSKIKNKPSDCGKWKFGTQKDRIKEEYNEKWGEKNSPERSAIIIEEVKQKYTED